MSSNVPAGISTCTDFFIRSLPTPWQTVHSPPRGTLLPAPLHSGHVLAILKPLSMTKVRVPVPLQVRHVVRLAPFFRPVPVHVLQLTTGDTLTFRTVPLQASRKLIPIVASRSAPRVDASPKPGPAFPNAPNSWLNKSDAPPPPPPNAAPKSWNPPARPPKPLNAFGSKPGCCEAAPYLS